MAFKTNAEMQNVITAGGAVQFNGQVLRTTAELPSDADIAALLAAQTAAQLNSTGGGSVGASVSEAEQNLVDNTTNDASTSKHGYVKKLNGFTTSAFMGDGNYRSVETHVATVFAADLNSATNVPLYTVPTGKTFIPTKIIVSNPSVSLSTWSGSFGFVTAAFTDVNATATHTTLTGATIFEIIPSKVGARLGAAADVLTLKNNILQGAPATADFRVFGILF